MFGFNWLVLTKDELVEPGQMVQFMFHFMHFLGNIVLFLRTFCSFLRTFYILFYALLCTFFFIFLHFYTPFPLFSLFFLPFPSFFFFLLFPSFFFLPFPSFPLFTKPTISLSFLRRSSSTLSSFPQCCFNNKYLIRRKSDAYLTLSNRKTKRQFNCRKYAHL